MYEVCRKLEVVTAIVICHLWRRSQMAFLAIMKRELETKCFEGTRTAVGSTITRTHIVHTNTTFV